MKKIKESWEEVAEGEMPPWFYLPAHRERWSWDAGLGETLRVDRAVSAFTSRDVASPAETATQHRATIRERGVPHLVQAHVDAWHRRWQTGEVRIIGDERAKRALRFAVYHLVAAANPDDEHASIGAQGLSGEAYRGRVFWDTGTYMLPFYLFTDPPAARALLMYRYPTLDAARRKARAYRSHGDRVSTAAPWGCRRLGPPEVPARRPSNPRTSSDEADAAQDDKHRWGRRAPVVAIVSQGRGPFIVLARASATIRKVVKQHRHRWAGTTCALLAGNACCPGRSVERDLVGAGRRDCRRGHGMGQVHRAPIARINWPPSRTLQWRNEMMQGWGTQGWGMGGGFGWGGGFVMLIVSVVVIVGIVFVARWAMEQGGRGRKPPAG